MVDSVVFQSSEINDQSVAAIEPRHSSASFETHLSPVAVMVLSIWSGLVAGLLELGVMLAQDAYHHTVTVDFIRTNRHFLWMIPVSNLIIFGAIGLLLGVFARSAPGRVIRLAAYALCFLAFLGPLLAIRSLHPIACVVVACGLAARLAPVVVARARSLRRLILISLPVLAGIVTLLVCVKGSQVLLREDRAMASLAAAAPGAPNVLLIVLDDVRADHLSLYGYDRETTPNLARLAGKGILFDRARAAAPWTLPSHASMFTGRWPHQLSTTVDQPLDTAHPTLAEYLAAHGYATAGFVGNTYYCNAWYGLDRGFAHYEDFYDNVVISPLEILRSSNLGERLVGFAGVKTATPAGKGFRKTAAMINRDALDWLSKQEGRPFFVFLNYYDAHAPFEPPEGYARQFGLGARDPAYREATFSKFRKLQQKKSPTSPEDPQTQELLRAATDLLGDSYDDCIAYLDGQVGRLTKELERRGLLDNTLVIVTSDHGEHLGDRGLFGHGHSLYRPLIHVPLLVIPPAEGPAGHTVLEPVSLRDLSATVVDLLGLEDLSPLPGQSLARCWSSEPARDRAAAEPPLSTVEHQKKFPPSPTIPASLGPLWSLADEQMIYIRNNDGREELYNLENDPSESCNLVGTANSFAVLERFRETLEQLLCDQQAPRQSGKPVE
jgi:arylsulfatase A-like enzyme